MQEPRDQNIRRRPIKLSRFNALRHRHNLEPPALFIIQNRAKHARRIKMRRAIPVDRSIHPHQRRRPHVSDNPVILNRLISHRLLSNPPKMPAHTRTEIDSPTRSIDANPPLLHESPRTRRLCLIFFLPPPIPKPRPSRLLTPRLYIGNCIRAISHEPPPCLHPPLALRPRARRPRPPPPPLALPPRARPNLFLRLLLPNLPNPRPARLQWNSPRLRIPARRHQFRRLRPFLVRAHSALVFQQQPRPNGPRLDWPPRLRPPHHQHLPARHAPPLLCLLSLLRQCRIRVLRLPIRQHASRSRLPLSFPGHAGISSPPSSAQSAHPRRDLSSSLGMFRIYFESGIAKIASGDPQWRHFTAMDEYYQNGPLPTWIGWYLQHLPHWFHAATAFGTLALELFLVWMLFFPRRVRIICFFIVTVWQIGVILSANYTFLNYLVLALAIFLLDDRFLVRFVPQSCRVQLAQPTQTISTADVPPQAAAPAWQQTS